MKYLLHCIIIIILNVAAFSSSAQFDPDKVCRIDDGQLVFTINLKWSDSEKKQLIELFDLDSVLVSQVFAGKTNIVNNGETWVVKPGKYPMAELTKSLQTAENAEISRTTVFRVIDQWMNFAGIQSETPATWGYNDLKFASAFIYTKGRALFFLPGFNQAKSVFIAGSFNNWSTAKTPMNKVSGGWAINLPMAPGKYTYKYIADGRWMTDPSNNLRENDGQGNHNSVVFCSNHIFTLKGFRDAKKVVVTGNFANWNPKGIAMKKSTEGWSLPVYLRDGTYAYKFLADGKWMTDPANPKIRKDAQGFDNSFLEIGEPFVFQLQGFTDAEKVVLTGSFNNWNRTELLMSKTGTGWQLPYVVAPGNYEYKFIVDGRWMPDPANPFTTGTGEYVNSVIAMKATHVFELASFANAKKVVVTGSFNRWNRDGYQMAREGGKWVLPLNLPNGKYTYKFIVDGTWILDPANKLYEENEYGTDNSVLWIE